MSAMTQRVRERPLSAMVRKQTPRPDALNGAKRTPLRLAVGRGLRIGRRACAAARASSAAGTVQRCAAGSRRAIQAQTKYARRGMKWARLKDLPQCDATPVGRHPAELGCPETVNPTGFDAGGVPMLRSRRSEARFVDKAVSRGLQTATRDHRSKTVDKFACRGCSANVRNGSKAAIRVMGGMGGKRTLVPRWHYPVNENDHTSVLRHFGREQGV